MGKKKNSMLDKIIGSIDNMGFKPHKSKKKLISEKHIDEILSQADDLVKSFKKLIHKH